MKKPHQVDEQEIMRFNMMRENQKGVIYTGTELKKILARLGYAPSGTLTKCFIERNIIVRIERGRYTFPPKPVHKSLLQTAFDDCASYRKKFRTVKEQTQEQEPQQLEVQQAIDLLKNLGYRVLRPTTQYEEV